MSRISLSIRIYRTKRLDLEVWARMNKKIWGKNVEN